MCATAELKYSCVRATIVRVKYKSICLWSCLEKQSVANEL